MTANSPPYALQAGSHSAQLFRQAFSISYASAGGIVAAGDYLVTQNGTPNMSVNVAGGVPGGQILVPGTTSAGIQGLYYGYNDATVNLAVAASDPTNPRIDRVVAQVQDAAYTGAVNSFSLAVVTGTPAGSPVAPSAPASSLSLATLSVAALATTVVTGNITDTRVALAASNLLASGQSTYKTVHTALALIPTSTSAATYGMSETNPSGTGLNSNSGAPVFYFDPADYPIGARTTKLRLRGVCFVTSGGPGVTLTLGLYPITGVTVNNITPGTVVAGSTVAFASPAASSLTQANSGDFTAPAAGFYALGVAVGGTTAGISSFRGQLQLRQV